MDYFNYLTDDLYKWNFREKEQVVKYYMISKFRTSNRMFEYENLPNHIDVNILELYLQSIGFMLAVNYNDKLYILPASLGGEFNEMYIPTEAIVSNPYLKLNKTYMIDEDCVLLKNDSMLQGLTPMFKRYSTMQCENDITLNIASINTRISSLISADDDKGYQSAIKFLEDIEKGKLGIIGEDTFMNDGVKIQPTASSSNSNIYTQLCEYDRYLQNSLYREIGLGATVNLKRENISENESQQDDDTLLPFVDDMLLCRKESIEKINKMFNTEISVKLSSAWEDRRRLIEKEIEDKESEVLENEDENTTD